MLNSVDNPIWVEYLGFYELTLNSIVLASTVKTPFELVYGDNVVLPLDYLIGATSHLWAKAAREMAWLVVAVRQDWEGYR